MFTIISRGMGYGNMGYKQIGSAEYTFYEKIICIRKFIGLVYSVVRAGLRACLSLDISTYALAAVNINDAIVQTLQQIFIDYLFFPYTKYGVQRNLSRPVH